MTSKNMMKFLKKHQNRNITYSGISNLVNYVQREHGINKAEQSRIAGIHWTSIYRWVKTDRAQRLAVEDYVDRISEALNGK